MVIGAATLHDGKAASRKLVGAVSTKRTHFRRLSGVYHNQRLMMASQDLKLLENLWIVIIWPSGSSHGATHFVENMNNDLQMATFPHTQQQQQQHITKCAWLKHSYEKFNKKTV